MSDDDMTFFGILSGCILVFVVVLGTLIYAGHNTTAEAVASPAYAMPPELEGAKVYILRPKGYGQRLYVVVRDGQPLATAWNEKSGKSTTQHIVETP
jgi:hypothetical protein